MRWVVVVVMMVIVVVMAVVTVVTLTVTPPGVRPGPGQQRVGRTAAGGPLGGAGHGSTNHVPLNLSGSWEASSDVDQEFVD